MNDETWFERNSFKILVFFLVIFAIEGAIWCWRMPADFKTHIIPKVILIADYEKRTNEKIDWIDKWLSDVNNRIDFVEEALIRHRH